MSESAGIDRVKDAEHHNAGQLDVTRQDTEQLDATQIHAQKLDTPQRDPARQGGEHLETGQKDAGQLDVAQQDTARLDATQPDTTQHPSQQSAAQLDTRQPDTPQLDITQRDAALLNATQRDILQDDPIQPDAKQLDDAPLDSAQPDTLETNDPQRDAEQLDGASPDATQMDPAQLESAQVDTTPLSATQRDVPQGDAVQPDIEQLIDTPLGSTQSGTVQLNATQPDAAQLHHEQPDAEQLNDAPPGAVQPDAEQLIDAPLESVQSGTVQLSATHPDTKQLDGAPRDFTQPDTQPDTQPNTQPNTQPDSAQLNTAHPDAKQLNDAPLDATPADVAAPSDTALMDTAPVDTAPVDIAPMNTAPPDAEQLDDVPLYDAPLEAAQIEAAEEDAAQLTDALEQTARRIVGADLELDSAGSESSYEDGYWSAGTSLSASATDYRYEYGRRFHAYQDGLYNLPNDDQEASRLELQHHIWYITLNGRLHLAPLKRPVGDVLDVGTGTGVWAIDFANVYPTSTVIGTDLSPIQPTSVPPNCSFLVDDANAEWAFGNRFDYIHIRSLITGLSDWDRLITQSYDNLRPGGWVELQETTGPLACDDESAPADAPVMKWVDQLTETSQKMGVDFGSPKRFASQLQDKGFVNVQEIRVKWAVGTWPKGRREKKIGELFQRDLIELVDAVSLRIYTRELGWEEDELRDFLEEVKADIHTNKRHVYVPIYMVFGQKPE